MKIVFFSPHAAVWIHAFPEALVAESLMQTGNDVVYLGCRGMLGSHCVAMSAHGVPFEATPARKERICRVCSRNAKTLRERFGFEGPSLEDLVLDEDLSLANRVAASATPQTCSQVELDGVAVGKIAAYELLIQSKKGALEFTSGEWDRYRASLKNVVIVLQAMKRLFGRTRPDRIVLYNALYSVNRTVCRLAEIYEVPQYFVHAGNSLANRLETLILARDHAYSYFARMRDQWAFMRHEPCSSEAMVAGTNHFLELIKGRSVWAYSPAPRNDVDVRRIFEIEHGQKIVCATMSSDDEFFAAETIGTLPADVPLLFRKQVEWIKALIAYAEKRSDVTLIIRVHPREFPNKREGVMSEHAKKLRLVLSKLPRNIKINWPTDQVSLYDLANVTDVFLNAWSSAGKEMAWLGLPVVLYSSDITLYPADLNYVGTTEEKYFQSIDQALHDGWDAERIRKTYRWCALEYQRSLLDISDSFHRKESGSVIAKVASKIVQSIAPYYEQARDCRRRAKRLSASPKINQILSDRLNSVLDLHRPEPGISQQKETEYLKREMDRLVTALYGSGENFRQDTLAHKLRAFADS